MSLKFGVQPKVSSAFGARFFCLAAAQNAPPTGGQPAGGAFCAADKRKNWASKENKHIKIGWSVSNLTFGS